jgi:Cu/Zn superoxide dismutase
MRQKFARRSILGFGLGGAGAALLGLTSRSQAATSFNATLNAASEVPPNQSPATGTATVTYDDSTKTVTWQGTFTGLSGPATAAHIHGPAEAGKNAGVIVAISQAGTPFTSPFQGSM